MSQSETSKDPQVDTSKQKTSPVMSSQQRHDKLKDIQALYRSQMKQIYNDGREKPQKPVENDSKNQFQQKKTLTSLVSVPLSLPDKNTDIAKSTSSIKFSDQMDKSKLLSLNSDRSDKNGDDRIRASVFLKGESTRTIEILRRENQTKQLKIRGLADKVENLLEKLKQHLDPKQFEAEVQNLKQFSDRKMQRLQNLFKIKNEEIFFKIKLQIIALLQEFQVPKQQINEINQVSNESSLFSFMVRKLKLKLKDFRNKQQSSSFEIQKDKIINQKYEERIHYLMETNELLKLSQSKLKQKVDDLKIQMTEFLEKLKVREIELQEREGEIFRLKRQNQQLSSSNQKAFLVSRNIQSEKTEERRMYEAKQKQMKTLLANYFLEKKKLESQLEEKQGQIEQILIKQKFLEQQNERINRQYVRWKERYEWLQREKEGRVKELEEEKNNIMNEFQEYKHYNNQGILMDCKTQVDEALRKVQDYQIAYQKVLQQLQEEKRLVDRIEQQAQERYEAAEKQWLDKVRKIERNKEEEITQIANDNQIRLRDMREQFQKKEKLTAQQMQARMRALLAEKDKRATESMIQVETQNDELRRQIENLNKVLEVKESLINVINNKKLAFAQ